MNNLEKFEELVKKYQDLLRFWKIYMYIRKHSMQHPNNKRIHI